MIAVLLVLSLALIALVLWCDQATKTDVREQQERAELAIDREATAAKRAMNEAAGQSWRNLVD